MNKNKNLIIIAIVLLTIINVFLVFKKDTNIVEKSKVSKIERKEFSIYKEQTYNGKDWKESNDTTFPTSGYLLNETQSKCYGYDNEPITPIPVKQELTKGSIDGRVTIESSKTIYCELYFDLDNKIPEVNEFGITGKTSSGDTLNNGYTYGLDVTYKGNWLDEDVVQYCISSNNITCDNWTEISSKDITVTTPSLTNGDGEKTMYIYLKDKANNVSVTTTKSTAKITVDRTKPVVNTFTLTGTPDTSQTLSNSTDYTHKAGITYNATITETNMEGYCVYEDSCNYQTTGSTTLNTSYTLKDTEGSHTVNIRVKDKAGNESDVSTQSIKLDLNNPTATISPNTQDTSSITVTVGYSGTDSIIARQCRLSGGSWQNTNKNESCTISNLNDGTKYTIEGRVRDASGRWNTTYPSVNVTTEKSEFSGTGKQLINYNPKGLTVTDCNGMKRFAGNCDARNGGCDGIVDNFVCFGYANITDCQSNFVTNEFIYRIIGITSSGEMKLIKNGVSGNEYKWHRTGYAEESKVRVLWSESDLYQEVNGSLFFDGILSPWREKILKYDWPNGVITWSDKLANQEVCSLENNEKNEQAFIGLPLLSDWLYAGGSLKSSADLVPFPGPWLALGMSGVIGVRYLNRWDGYVQMMEWSMQTSYTMSNGYYEAYSFYMNGPYYDELYFAESTPIGRSMELFVRPVFFLGPSVRIESGTGTSSDPFIIAK